MQCHFQAHIPSIRLIAITKSHARLVAFVGQQLNAYGKAIINCQHKGKTYPVVFEVIDQDISNILGLSYSDWMLSTPR